jgi:hypothetical protein
VHVDLDTLATALYVKIDDELEGTVSAAQPVATEGRDRSEDHRRLNTSVAFLAGYY